MPRGRVTVAGVQCTAKGCGKRFTSLRGVRAHYAETGHESFKNATARRERVNPQEYPAKPANRR